MSRSPSPAFSLNAESWDDSAPEETKSPQRSKVASVIVKPSSPSRPSQRDSTPAPRKRSPSPSTRQPAAKSRRESSTPAPSRKNTAFCPHCNTLVSKPLRRHFAHNHLPWYADPARICWVCETAFISNSELEQHFTGRCQNGQFVNFTAKWCPLISEMLCHLARALNVTSPVGLMQYVISHPKLQPTEEITPTNNDIKMMVLFDQYHQVRPQPIYQYKPPNSVATLTQFRILAALLQEVPDIIRKEILNLTVKKVQEIQEPLKVVPEAPSTSTHKAAAPVKRPEPTKVVPVAPPTPPVTPEPQEVVPQSVTEWGVNAHFHWDKFQSSVMSENRKKSAIRSPEEVLQLPPRDSPQFRLTRAYPCYCFPETFPKTSYLEHGLPDVINKIALGWHPTRADAYFGPKQAVLKKQFQEILGLPNTLALGEIGLDYCRVDRQFGDITSYGEEQITKQKRMFAELVQLAMSYGKPIMLQIRDNGQENIAMRDACGIMQQQRVPRNHPIYLHCFGYGVLEMWLWTQAFPRVIVGFAPKMVQTGDPGFRQVVEEIAADRFVLETDAPYFHSGGYEYGAPSQIRYVASKVAQWRHSSIPEVLRAAAATARDFYHQ